jgi:hypothetical protein
MLEDKRHSRLPLKLSTGLPLASTDASAPFHAPLPRSPPDPPLQRKEALSTTRPLPLLEGGKTDGQQPEIAPMASNGKPPMPIQIAATESRIVALLDDGTIWYIPNSHGLPSTWHPLPDIPTASRSRGLASLAQALDPRRMPPR